MNYTLTLDESHVLRNDGVVVRLEPSDPSFADYQTWLSAGNTPAPYAPPPSVLLGGFIASVQAALTASDGVMTRTQEAISLGLNTANSPDVIAYINYRRALRALLKSTAAGSLPISPPFPAGT